MNDLKDIKSFNVNTSFFAKNSMFFYDVNFSESLFFPCELYLFNFRGVLHEKSQHQLKGIKTPKFGVGASFKNLTKMLKAKNFFLNLTEIDFSIN